MTGPRQTGYLTDRGYGATNLGALQAQRAHRGRFTAAHAQARKVLAEIATQDKALPAQDARRYAFDHGMIDTLTDEGPLLKKVGLTPERVARFVATHPRQNP